MMLKELAHTRRAGRRALAALLACLLTLALLPATALAADPEPVIPTAKSRNGVGYIYANGLDLLLEEGATADATKVSYRPMGSSGDYTPFEVTGDGIIDIQGDTTSGYDLSKYCIYGGSYQAAVAGAAKITMQGGKVKFIYGGGQTHDGLQASVGGGASVVIDGGSVTSGVYGGGDNDTVTGSTSVAINGGTVHMVNGGGSGISSTVTLDAAVTVNGGTVDDGVVGCSSKVQRNVTININGGTVGSIQGTDYGTVDGDVSIAVKDGTVEQNIITATSTGTVTGAKTVTIGGGAKVGGNGYGGMGVVINSADATTPGAETSGVDSFQIKPALTSGAAVYAVLPAGSGAGATIATDAAAGDAAYVHLTGPGAAGLTAAYENGTIVTKAAATTTPTAENTDNINCIFANGLDLLLEAGATEGTTKVSYRPMGSSGDYTPFAVTGADGSLKNGYKLSQYEIYGGSNQAAVAGDTLVTMEGGKVHSIYGGGRTYDGKEATIGGGTGVVIDGGSVTSIVYGGGDNDTVTGSTSVTINGGTVALVRGGGSGTTSTVTLDAAVTVNGGSVTSAVSGCVNTVQRNVTIDIKGGTVGSIQGTDHGTVNGDVSIAVTGGTVTGITGAASGTVGGDVSIAVTGGTVTNSIFLGTGTVTGAKTVTVGGGAKVGGKDSSSGIFINNPDSTAPGSIAQGVDSFQIKPALTSGAAVYAVLPTGSGAGATIATNAAAGDAAYVHLTGPGAAGLTAAYENGAIVTKAAATPPPTGTVPTAEMIGNINYIFANGTDLLLEAGRGAYTKVSYRPMGSAEAYTPFEVTGASGSLENGYDLSQYHIYGGGNQAAVTGDTLVTMAGGTVGNIYGGGLDAAVTGSTHVVVGGKVIGSVLGGGKIGLAGSPAPVAGGTNVTVAPGGTVKSKVYGGGESGAAVAGGTTVLIQGVVEGSVFGGGSEAPVGAPGAAATASVTVAAGGKVQKNVFGGGDNPAGKVTGQTQVTIRGTVTCSVYGGGWQCGVDGDTAITVAPGGRVYGQKTSLNAIDGDGVYGGSYMPSPSDAGYATNAPSPITGDTSITIGGRVSGSIYGGALDNGHSASAAVAGKSAICVQEGGAVSKDVYGSGSGENAAVEGQGAIDVSGTVGQSIYGGPAAVAAHGGAVIGSDENQGVVLGGGTDPVTNGVESFAIGTGLSAQAAVYVVVPAGMEVGATIATGAAAGDLAGIHLTGPGALGMETMLEGASVKLGKAPLPTVEQDGNLTYIFANGAALLIDGSESSTTIYVDFNRNGVLDAGIDQSLAALGIAGAPADNTDLYSYTVYGGGHNTDVAGDTQITMLGGQVHNICGGGWAQEGQANVGATRVTLQGGICTDLCGGGRSTGSYTATCESTRVTMTGGTVGVTFPSGGGYGGTVRGGGQAAMSGDHAAVKGATTVSITGTAAVRDQIQLGGSSPAGPGSTLTVGGEAVIGDSDHDGIILNGGNIDYGAESFAIEPSLEEDAGIYVTLPADAADGMVLATGAVEDDLAHIHLQGEGAAGLTARYKASDNTIRASSDQVAAYTTDGGATWIPCDSLGQAMAAVDTADDAQKYQVRLLSDVGEWIDVKAGTFTLDLNGWTWSSAARQATMTMAMGTHVTITDSAGGGMIRGADATENVAATAAVEMNDTSALTLTGNKAFTIRGGDGRNDAVAEASLEGADGVDLRHGGSLTVSGTGAIQIMGGNGGDTSVKKYKPVGGSGVYAGHDQATVAVTNPNALLRGGDAGQNSGDGSGAAGGSGLELKEGTLTATAGTFQGGRGSDATGSGTAGTGGIGLSAYSAVHLSGGRFLGGRGGQGSAAVKGGTGGMGLLLQGAAGTTPFCDLTCTGGDGGMGKTNGSRGHGLSIGHTDITIESGVYTGSTAVLATDGASSTAHRWVIHGGVFTGDDIGLDVGSQKDASSLSVTGGTFTGNRFGANISASFEKDMLDGSLSGGTFTASGVKAADCAVYYGRTGGGTGDLLAAGSAYFDVDGSPVTQGLDEQELGHNTTLRVAPVGSTPAALYSITGQVSDATAVNLEGYVALLQNGVELQRFELKHATTQGYIFTGVAPGAYTVVAVTTTGNPNQNTEKRATALATVGDHDLTGIGLGWGNNAVGTEVDVKPNTPPVAVGGLAAVAADMPIANKDAVVRLTAAATEEPAGKGAIAALAPGKTLDYLDITLKLFITEGGRTTETDLGGSNDVVLELVLPYDFTNKRDVAVYRYHGAEAAKLTALTGAPDIAEDGTFWPDAAGGCLHIYASKFSTYALGYTAGSGGFDDFAFGTSSHTITAAAGVGGAIAPSGKVSVGHNGSKTFAIKPDKGYTVADVLVDGKSVGAVESYTFEKVTADHTITTRFAAAKAAWNPFADVGADDWFYDSVKYVYEHDLMLGTSATAFSPAMTTERGMIATILWRMEGQPAAAGTRAFTDVAADAYYADAVAWADAKGIALGYGNGTFGPRDTITREQLAAMLWRYAQYKGADGSAAPLTGFADGSAVAGYAQQAVAWAVEQGILTGRGNGTLDPKGSATRAETAAMLARLAAAMEK